MTFCWTTSHIKHWWTMWTSMKFTSWTSENEKVLVKFVFGDRVYTRKLTPKWWWKVREIPLKISGNSRWRWNMIFVGDRNIYMWYISGIFPEKIGWLYIYMVSIPPYEGNQVSLHWYWSEFQLSLSGAFDTPRRRPVSNDVPMTVTFGSGSRWIFVADMGRTRIFTQA